MPPVEILTIHHGEWNNAIECVTRSEIKLQVNWILDEWLFDRPHALCVSDTYCARPKSMTLRLVCTPLYIKGQCRNRLLHFHSHVWVVCGKGGWSNSGRALLLVRLFSYIWTLHFDARGIEMVHLHNLHSFRSQ